MTRAALGLSLLAVAVLGSALGAVYTKHQSRKLFVQLQALQEEQTQMDVQWGQLQLEQSAWDTHGRIEGLARSELQMHIPEPADVVIVRP